MKTTKLGFEIIKAAEDVLALGYRAHNRNLYGEVLENVVKEFDMLSKRKYYRGKGKQQPDYCAITQSVILDRAFKRYNDTVNTIRSASAGEFRTLAKKHGIRIDKKPAVGSLFTYPRNGGSGFHIGLVYKTNNNDFDTIEGNTYSSNSYIISKDGCATKLGANEYGILTRPRKISAGMEFLHIEELFSKEVFDYPNGLLSDANKFISQPRLAEACLIPTNEVPEIEGDFEGSEAVPKSVFTTETKVLIGCGAGLVLLALFTKFK